jgi:hypothetical protein
LKEALRSVGIGEVKQHGAEASANVVGFFERGRARRSRSGSSQAGGSLRRSHTSRVRTSPARRLARSRVPAPVSSRCRTDVCATGVRHSRATVDPNRGRLSAPQQRFLPNQEPASLQAIHPNLTPQRLASNPGSGTPRPRDQ